MNNSEKELVYYLKKYIEKTISAEEFENLDDMLTNASEEEQKRAFSAIWTALESNNDSAAFFSNESSHRILSDILSEQMSSKAVVAQTSTIKSRNFIPYWAAAACLVLSFAMWVYWSSSTRSEVSISIASTDSIDSEDIEPGRNVAVLTIGNGERIVLGEQQAGVIKTKDGIEILKFENGDIHYRETAVDRPKEMHTVHTPRGGQINFSLPDGTKVWLNAASSIRYPSRFDGDIREVEVEGEVYFEVPHLSGKFVVRNRWSEVEVLGTKFNVRAYEEEQFISTALIEGEVRISANGVTRQMEPNDFATVTTQGGLRIEYRPDIAHEIAWKDGFFLFDDTALPSITQQIARWYDIEVDLLATANTSKRLTGKIRRDVKLSKMIEMLEFSGLHCQYNTGKLVIN